jgi:uncharacterized protein YdcH (DUF465 family)
MTHVAHELAQEFPAHVELIQKLRHADRHFNGLCDRYHSENRDIHRIEAGLEAATDERLETLKKQRLVVADEVATVLGGHKGAP